ncbi:MAG: VanZ family protein [Pseudomonadales bacterium]
MSNRPADGYAAWTEAGDRVSALCLRMGFWVPLLLCTWLALTPSPPESVFRVSDILLHGFAFAYLTFALGLAHGSLRPWAVVAWMLGYGVLIELVQSFEPSRAAELKDLLVDCAGIAVGLLLLIAFGAWSRRLLRSLIGLALPVARD